MSTATSEPAAIEGLPADENAPAIEPAEDNHGLTPHDVLKPEANYSASGLRILLGITPRQIGEARAEGFLLSTSGAYGANCRWSGRDILNWIEATGAPYQISAETARIHRQVHGDPEAPPAEEAPSPPSVIDQAAELLSQQDARARVSEDDWQQHGLDRYLKILSAAKPTRDDADTLAQIMRDLGLTPEQVADDRRLIVRAQELAALHADRQAAAEAWRQTIGARREQEARHKAEQREMRARLHKADWRRTQADEAGDKLGQLRRRRPELFQPGDDGLPQLRGVAKK